MTDSELGVRGASGRRGRWVGAVVGVGALCFLVFVGGAAVAEFKVFPYRSLFAGAFSYVHAMSQHERETAIARAKGRVIPEEGKLTVPAQAGAYEGYTFLTFDAGRPSTARLLDMDGRVVHEWHRDFSAIWPVYPHPRAHPSGDDGFAWRYGKLFPNGDIIVTVKDYGDTPDGYGLVKLDKDSNVIWAIAEHFHHEFSIGPDGTIYALEHDWRDTRKRPVPGLRGLPELILEDFVVEVSPEGKVRRRVSLLDAMTAAGVRALTASSDFNRYDYKAWDRLHPNDVEVVTQAYAAKHPSFLSEGEVVVSVRDLDALVVVDLAKQRVTRVMRGPWVRQHDVDLLKNGDMMVFDNRGGQLDDGAGSRVLEFNPATELVDWSYQGTAEDPLRSDVCGGQDRLPNGNTLIAEDEGGRVLEVTPGGKIVWEYTDVRVHHAVRVAKDWVKFPLEGMMKARGRPAGETADAGATNG